MNTHTRQQYIHIHYSWQHSKLITSLFSYWILYFDCCFLNSMVEKYTQPWGLYCTLHLDPTVFRKRQASPKAPPHLTYPTTSPPPFIHRSPQKNHRSPLTSTRDLARVTLPFLKLVSCACAC